MVQSISREKEADMENKNEFDQNIGKERAGGDGNWEKNGSQLECTGDN